MQQVRGNIWDYHRPGNWLGITTNGFVKRNGEAVMGAGIAKEAANRYPELPRIIGNAILKHGNKPVKLPRHGLFTFPVKHHWSEEADPELIKQSAEILYESMYGGGVDIKGKAYLVRPGCGNGKLSWAQVEPIMEQVFPESPFERLIIVDWARS